jgi:hypothetical protein
MFNGVHYVLTQQEYDELVAEEVVTRRFAAGWDALILPFKVSPFTVMTKDRMISRPQISKVF